MRYLRMLRLLARPARVARRQFSKYIEDNYGKNVHRLANRPEVECSASEIFVCTLGTLLLISDVSTISRNVLDYIRIVCDKSIQAMRAHDLGVEI